MCESVHQVKITNVQNSETFHHPVILLKGELTDPCSLAEEPQLFVGNDRTPVSFSVAVEKNSRNVGGNQSTRRHFRALLRLLEGKHEYVVQYCRFKTSITLIYSARHSPYTVVPLYIVCKGHTGRFQSHDNDLHNDSETACKKITLAIELLQCLYGEKLYELGFGRKTFTLGAGCVPFFSELDWARSTTMTESELWHHFAAELVQSKRYDLTRVKLVAFLSSTHFEGISNGDYSYENIRRKTTGNAALGGGGLALFGTGCLYTWPTSLEAVCGAFLNKQAVECDKLLDDSNYRRTYGGCFATTLGSVCHEMGHTFDLGHTPDDSIMGGGFDAVDNVFVGSPSYDDNAAVAPRRHVETKPSGLAGKLTQLKRPGDLFRQRLEAKQNDNVFFAPISALTLSYHRWFNHSDHHHHVSGSLGFDSTARSVSCGSSWIVLAELRSTGTGMMQRCWTFPDTQAATTFMLPKLPNLEGQTLFVMDASGNMLKVDLGTV